MCVCAWGHGSGSQSSPFCYRTVEPARSVTHFFIVPFFFLIMLDVLLPSSLEITWRRSRLSCRCPDHAAGGSGLHDTSNPLSVTLLVFLLVASLISTLDHAEDHIHAITVDISKSDYQFTKDFYLL